MQASKALKRLTDQSEDEFKQFFTGLLFHETITLALLIRIWS